MKFLLAFLLAFQAPQPHVLVHPPIPKQLKHETTAIIILDKPQTDQQIKQLIQPYHTIKLRKIFHKAIDGFSVQGRSDQIEKLAAQNKQVYQMSPVTEYRVESEESVQLIGGDAVRSFFDKKNQRLTGKGITVGVIDTGVDYTHPDLRRNYAGGHDLVDEDNDPMETKTAGKATFHGTHVAGIIAANGKIKGVAPEAKIVAYRALGPGGAGTTEQVLAAIEEAIKDKVDVVNLSLGNDINGPDLPISMALNRAVDSGIVAVAASGNSGPRVWTVGSPGTASKAISVGASTPTMKIPFLEVEGEREPVRIQPLEGSDQWNLDRSLNLIDGGLGRKHELQNVKGKIVLIKRGILTFSQKAENARAAGAKAVLIYNNVPGNFLGNLEAPIDLPVGSLTKEEGEKLRKKLHSRSLTARLKIQEEKDQLADFSSRGPVTGTWDIKPDIVAPGVAINSTVPGGYLSLQGTSMAAPHVAGACALIKQAHPEWSPKQIKAAIMNTAIPLIKKAPQKNAKRTGNFSTTEDGEGHYYRTYEQGAGRIQVDEAIKAESLVTPSSIRFGKYTSEGDEHKVILKVENTSNKTLRYSFGMPTPVEGLSWHFPISFVLEPKEVRAVTIELKVEPGLLKGKIFDGYLTLQAGSDTMRIPYMYVLEEPGYPRVMGFSFTPSDRPGLYKYEVYLPGGAEEFGIALFNMDDYRFVGFLDTSVGLRKGQIRKELKAEDLPPPGTYRAKIFARKAGKEDYIETMITIEE